MSDKNIESINPIKLGELASDVDIREVQYISLSEKEADIHFKARDYAMMEMIVKSIIPAFTKINLFVVVFIAICFLFDTFIYLAVEHSGYIKTVDKGVLMSLIAATAAQLGIVSVAIGRFFFPTKGSDQTNTSRRGRRQSARQRGTAISNGGGAVPSIQPASRL